jgi:tetratricopeptide (TPR) repeat protein
MALAEADLPDLAKAHFEAVLKENPRDAMALYRVARIEYDARDIPAARRHFRESLDASTSQPNLAAENHYYLGLIYAEQGRFNAAVEEYDRAVGLQPEQGNYYYWRAMAWRALGDRNRASGDFLKAADKFDTVSPEWSERARQMAFESS